jgi:hypothetical protein
MISPNFTGVDHIIWTEKLEDKKKNPRNDNPNDISNGQ